MAQWSSNDPGGLRSRGNLQQPPLLPVPWDLLSRPGATVDWRAGPSAAPLNTLLSSVDDKFHAHITAVDRCRVAWMIMTVLGRVMIDHTLHFPFRYIEVRAVTCPHSLLLEAKCVACFQMPARVALGNYEAWGIGVSMPALEHAIINLSEQLRLINFHVRQFAKAMTAEGFGKEGFNIQSVGDVRRMVYDVLQLHRFIDMADLTAASTPEEAGSAVAEGSGKVAGRAAGTGPSPSTLEKLQWCSEWYERLAGELQLKEAGLSTFHVRQLKHKIRGQSTSSSVLEYLAFRSKHWFPALVRGRANPLQPRV